MFHRLAKLISSYPRWVLGGWLLLTLLALPLAARVGEALDAQPGYAPGSTAAEVRDKLIGSFENQDQHTVVLLSRSDTSRAGQPAFDAAYRQIIEQIAALPKVQDVRDYRNSEVLPLRSEDGSFVVSILGIATDTPEETTATVGRIKGILDDAGGLESFLAGGPATQHELEAISERDTRRAELFGLPLSLLVLCVAFGALVASGLPLLVALTSITLSFALLFLLG
ncbi:MAG TPA: MMPL family transporter, partial [Trueperaceae bacterium]